MWYNEKHTGDSPSGKAVGSGPTIRGFESLISSQVEIMIKLPWIHGSFLFCILIFFENLARFYGVGLVLQYSKRSVRCMLF